MCQRRACVRSEVRRGAPYGSEIIFRIRQVPDLRGISRSPRKQSADPLFLRLMVRLQPDGIPYQVYLLFPLIRWIIYPNRLHLNVGSSPRDLATHLVHLSQKSGTALRLTDKLSRFQFILYGGWVWGVGGVNYNYRDFKHPECHLEQLGSRRLFSCYRSPVPWNVTPLA